MLNRNFDLSGKNALITGAAGLLGLEHCEALLECDANLVLVDINNKKLNEVKNYLIDKWIFSMLPNFWIRDGKTK